MARKYLARLGTVRCWSIGTETMNNRAGPQLKRPQIMHKWLMMEVHLREVLSPSCGLLGLLSSSFHLVVYNKQPSSLPNPSIHDEIRSLCRSCGRLRHFPCHCIAHCMSSLIFTNPQRQSSQCRRLHYSIWSGKWNTSVHFFGCSSADFISNQVVALGSCAMMVYGAFDGGLGWPAQDIVGPTALVNRSVGKPASWTIIISCLKLRSYDEV